MVLFKELPADVRTYINEKNPWRTENWNPVRPVAPLEHLNRAKPVVVLVPRPSTRELVIARRDADKEARKRKQRACDILSMLGLGHCLELRFREWRRNVRRSRTFMFGHERMRWIYGRFTTDGRTMSRALLGWVYNIRRLKRHARLLFQAIARWQSTMKVRVRLGKEWHPNATRLGLHH